MEPEA
jgi:hypothetical protein